MNYSSGFLRGGGFEVRKKGPRRLMGLKLKERKKTDNSEAGRHVLPDNCSGGPNRSFDAVIHEGMKKEVKKEKE